MKLKYLNNKYFFKIIKLLSSNGIFQVLLSNKIKKQIKKIKRSDIPQSIILYVTNKCNAKCSHCFYWEDLNAPINELSIGDYEKLVHSIPNKINTLSITGGEPFLRKELIDICEVFYDSIQPQKYVINTNGYYVDRVNSFFEDFLKKKQFNTDLDFHVSLDGQKDLHNSIRKINIYDKAMDTISLARKFSKQHKNMNVSVQVTVSNKNIDQLDGLIAELKERFDIYPSLNPVRSPDTDVKNIDPEVIDLMIPKDSDRLSLEGYEHLLSLLSKRHRDVSTVLSSYDITMVEYMIGVRKNIPPGFPCFAGKYDSVIYANGYVAMCEFSKPFANLREYDMNLKELWNSYVANERRKQINKCFCTHSCHLMNSMRFSRKALLRVLSNI